MPSVGTHSEGGGKEGKQTTQNSKPTQMELEAKADEDATALAQLIYELYKQHKSPYNALEQGQNNADRPQYN